MEAIKYVDKLISRYPVLAECENKILAAYGILVDSFMNKKKLLVCGNGGSAADSEHIVGELMKEFRMKRKLHSYQVDALEAINPEMGRYLADNLQGALPAIALTNQVALSTAFMNDCDSLLVFAQQVNGYGDSGDVFLGISTSGNSANVIYAAITAKARGLKVIGLTGAEESKLSNLADVCIRVPEIETFKVQEFHLPIYHCLCLMLEDFFFGDRSFV